MQINVATSFFDAIVRRPLALAIAGWLFELPSLAPYPKKARTTHLTFLGAVGTVTGSKYLVEAGPRRILVDCGLFQGYKQLRLRNWSRPPVDPRRIDAVVLTHAHLDHSGYLPVLVKAGFNGPVLSTAATRDLCEVLLPDSGFLQEKDAEFANRHGFSKHRPALPLYAQADATAALRRFTEAEFGTERDLGGGLTLRLHRAGHILGAAMVELRHDGRSLLFSGDLGRPNDPVMLPPAEIARADTLVVESTYGNHTHSPDDPEELLADVIERTCERGGSILIPAFAVGRAQTLLYHLHRLKSRHRLANVPIYLDSPMAIDASEIFCRHIDDHRLDARECRAACGVASYIQTAEESKALAAVSMPKIIISASGMATGGRVLHHLKAMAPDRRNTVLFTGYQAGGTRGAAMLSGAEAVKIHGQYVPVRADVCALDMLSAHADANEIMRWLGRFEAPPRMTFVTHGEPDASDALRRRIAHSSAGPAPCRNISSAYACAEKPDDVRQPE